MYIISVTLFLSHYFCHIISVTLCLFSTLSCRVDALQTSIITIIIHQCIHVPNACQYAERWRSKNKRCICSLKRTVLKSSPWHLRPSFSKSDGVTGYKFSNTHNSSNTWSSTISRSGNGYQAVQNIHYKVQSMQHKPKTKHECSTNKTQIICEECKFSRVHTPMHSKLCSIRQVQNMLGWL